MHSPSQSHYIASHRSHLILFVVFIIGTFYTHKIDLEEEDHDDDNDNDNDDDSTTVKFSIWDTPGGEKFRSVAPLYYKHASAAIVVYDVTNYLSFLSAKTWIEELWEQRGSNGNDDDNNNNNDDHKNHHQKQLVIALVGNKVDLLESKPSKNKNGTNNDNNDSMTKTLEEADAYARKANILHLGTSAKTATNVKALFHKIAKKLLPTPEIRDPGPPDGGDGDSNGDDDDGEQQALIVDAETSRGEIETTRVPRVLASCLATLLNCFKRKGRRGG